MSKRGEKAFYIRVSGKVQGVGYRFHCKRTADKYGVFGWVRNMAGGDVEMEVAGREEAVDKYIEDVTVNGFFFRVEGTKINRISPDKESGGFTIKH